jgi:hypothetical protein
MKRQGTHIAAIGDGNIQRVLDPIGEGRAVRRGKVRGTRRLGRDGFPHAGEGAAAVVGAIVPAQECGRAGGEGGLGGGGGGGGGVLANVAVCADVGGKRKRESE